MLPEIEFLQLQRQLTESEGELAITKASVRRALAAREEARERSEQRGRGPSSRKRASNWPKARGELAVINETLKGAADQVSGSTELVSRR